MTESSPVSPLESSGPPARRRKTGIVWGLVVVGLLVLGGWGGTAGRAMYRARQFESDCRSARDRSDWNELLLLSREWSDEQPHQGIAWLLRAEAAAKLEDFVEAHDALGRVPEDDERWLGAMLERASLEWSQLNRPLDSVATYEQVLAREPRVVDAHGHCIAFYAFTMQRAPMLAAIRRALDAGAEPPDAYTYLILADKITLTNGQAICQRWLAADPQSSTLRIALAVQTGQALAMNATLAPNEDAAAFEAESIRRLVEFLETYPDDPVLLGYLLEHFVEAGDVERVGELLGRVPDRAADDHMLWVARGWWHAQQGQLNEAVEALEEALRLHPMSGRARYELSAVGRQLQWDEERIERLGRLAFENRELRKQILRLPSTDVFDVPAMVRLARYASACGDEVVAKSLLERRLPPGAVGGSVSEDRLPSRESAGPRP